MKLLLRNAAQTLELGEKLFSTIRDPLRIYLYGDLGTGKTTLVRGFLRACGYLGPVRSPTFTLVEEYAFPDWRLVHLDLYRLADPEELEWIGIRDYFDGHCSAFIEWPDRGLGYLPLPDLSIRLELAGEGRSVSFEPETSSGAEITQILANIIQI